MEEGSTKSQLFSIGSEVEVRSDEEGFKGVWFEATIVQTPPTNSASKKKKKALVQYKELLTEDRTEKLKEHVDWDYIRPLPPQVADQDLEEGHVVDAFTRDGWWTGIVQKVFKHDSKFIVYCENPPDLMETDKDHIRWHQDWVAGQWVRPNKQEVLEASVFQELARLCRNNFNHLEVVGQPKNSGAAGNTPQSTNSMKNLVVQSSHTQDVAPNGSGADLRPLKKSKDGKVSEATSSVTPSQSSKLPNDKEMLYELATLSRGSSETRGRRSRKPVLSHQFLKKESLLGEKKVNTKQEKDGELDNRIHGKRKRRTKSGVGSAQEGYICALPSQERQIEKGKEGYGIVGSAGKATQKKGIRKEAEVPVTAAASKGKGNEGSLAEYPCQIPNEDLLKLVRDPKKNPAVTSKEKNMELKRQPNDGTTHKRKRGRPKKLEIVSPQASKGVRELNGSASATEKNAVAQRFDEVALCAPGVRDSTDSQDASGTTSIPNEAAMTLVKASDNTYDDDLPLSTWLGELQFPADADELNGSDEEVLAIECTPLDSISDVAPNGNQVMPFVKSSPIWKTIESLDVFRIMPQNPHFRPLVKCKEEYREGFAIGNMVTFSSLVEKISSLNYDDPKAVFDSILESLFDLEKYGFSVTPLRGRVDELLSIKRRQGQFEGETKDAESMIVEQTLEKSKLEEEADNITKKITELKEKHGLIKAEIGAKEGKIASLQLAVDSINENIKNARSDFERAASAPLTQQ